MGCFGDGGAITTNDKELAIKCKMLANHGRIAKYDHEFVGRNSRLDGLQAAILSVKLKHLEGWIDRRRAIANRYLTELANNQAFDLPNVESWAGHVFHLFVLKAKNRDSLANLLDREAIQYGIHYPVALPDLPAFSIFRHIVFNQKKLLKGHKFANRRMI